MKSSISEAHWLSIAEKVAIASSFGGLIIGAISKQFLWAAIPLSASAAFASFDRQRLKSLVEREREAIAVLVADNKQRITTVNAEFEERHQQSQSDLAELETELKGVKKLVTASRLQLQQQEEGSMLTVGKIENLQNSLSQLDSFSQNLSIQLDTIDNKHKETGKLVRQLKAIDIFTQSIKADANTTQAYYERGLAYQRLGNRHRAVDDYTKTIELDSKHAQAHHYRGLLYKEMGIEQKAAIDLRKASQLYFDKGNLDKYRELRDLSQQIYKNSDDSTTSIGENSQVAVGNLFG